MYFQFMKEYMGAIWQISGASRGTGLTKCIMQLGLLGCN